MLETYYGKCVEINGDSIIFSNDRFNIIFDNHKKDLFNIIEDPFYFNECYAITINSEVSPSDSNDIIFYLKYISQKAHQIVDADFETKDELMSIHISGHNSWTSDLLHTDKEPILLTKGTSFKLVSIERCIDNSVNSKLKRLI